MSRFNRLFQDNLTILDKLPKQIIFFYSFHNQLEVKYNFEFSGKTEINQPLENNEKIVQINAKLNKLTVLISNEYCSI
ncbi:unnamed protein product [Paramecium sonneborni]|uniref:Uncharacterized protein n=1 Tax=Paramecium sonneborni TaxID=65129 RepID=A0A8S1N2J2_9CILI|nr:unnamed protein product [Paramecium sonneborni]